MLSSSDKTHPHGIQSLCAQSLVPGKSGRSHLPHLSNSVDLDQLVDPDQCSTVKTLQHCSCPKMCFRYAEEFQIITWCWFVRISPSLTEVEDPESPDAVTAPDSAARTAAAAAAPTWTVPESWSARPATIFSRVVLPCDQSNTLHPSTIQLWIVDEL